MKNFFGTVDRDQIDTAEEFANYCQQRMGIPYPTGKGMATLKRNAKLFFKQNPNATWGTLVRTVDWCRNNNRRVANAYSIIPMVRYAWAKGALPELDARNVTNDELEAKILEALQVEKDQWWRDRLQAAVGVSARSQVYEDWQANVNA